MRGAADAGATQREATFPKAHIEFASGAGQIPHWPIRSLAYSVTGPVKCWSRSRRARLLHSTTIVPACRCAADPGSWWTVAIPDQRCTAARCTTSGKRGSSEFSVPRGAARHEALRSRLCRRRRQRHRQFDERHVRIRKGRVPSCGDYCALRAWRLIRAPADRAVRAASWRRITLQAIEVCRHQDLTGEA